MDEPRRLDQNKTLEFVNEQWDSSIIPEISEYIKIPNKSPHFDPDWEANGHMEKAVQMLEAWATQQPVGRGQPHPMLGKCRTIAILAAR